MEAQRYASSLTPPGETGGTLIQSSSSDRREQKAAYMGAASDGTVTSTFLFFGYRIWWREKLLNKKTLQQQQRKTNPQTFTLVYKKGHTFMLSNPFRLLILPLTLEFEMAYLDSGLDFGNQNSSRNLLALQLVEWASRGRSLKAVCTSSWLGAIERGLP